MTKQEKIEKLEQLLDGYRASLEKAKSDSKSSDKRTREGAEFRIKSDKAEINKLEQQLAQLKGITLPPKKRGRKSSQQKAKGISLNNIEF